MSVRERRRNLGLTQVELAERVGCDQTTISNIEIGDSNPSLRLAQRLATVLGCTLDELFASDDEAVAT